MAESRYRVRRSRGPLPSALLDVDGLLGSPRTRVLKASARATVGVVTVGGSDLVLKRFRDTGLPQILETAFLGSRADRVRRGALRLAAADFPVPEVVAVLEAPRWGLPLESCVATRWVPGEPLDVAGREWRGSARRALTVALADWLRALHAAGLYPQDLRAANLLIPPERPLHFVLVDLDRVRRYRHLSWRRRRKHLVQVHRSVGRGASRASKLRFLRRYLVNPTRGELRRIVREVLWLSGVKDAEYARRRGERPAARRSG